MRRLSIFLGLFLVANILFFSIEYKRYVSSAPIHLKEARKNIVNAMMFHAYYIFLVKTIRIDFLNPILYPLKAPRDYFYKKGVNKLPSNDTERAIWFDMFEVRPYNFSVAASYGSMAKRYGHDFSSEFIDKVYENIRIMSLKKLSDKNTPDISENVLEVYIDLINLYTFDFHLHPEGFIFREENMGKVSTDIELYQRFEYLYQYGADLLNYYNEEHTAQYNRVLNPKKGWYSPYKNFHYSRYIISSFILFYKIRNEIFDCKKDKRYRNSKSYSLKKLIKLLKKYPKKSNQVRTTKRMVAYLHIPNMLDSKSVNLKLKNTMGYKMYCD